MVNENANTQYKYDFLSHTYFFTGENFKVVFYPLVRTFLSNYTHQTVISPGRTNGNVSGGCRGGRKNENNPSKLATVGPGGEIETSPVSLFFLAGESLDTLVMWWMGGGGGMERRCREGMGGMERIFRKRTKRIVCNTRRERISKITYKFVRDA